MTRTKFKNDERVTYVNGPHKHVAKVLMVNGAVPYYDYKPFYDIQIGTGDATEVYTVHEKYLRPLMSDTAVAQHIARDYTKAQQAIGEARAALKRVRKKLEEDGQPDYELRMVDEFDIVLKNTLRFELTSEANRWADIVVERKKGK